MNRINRADRQGHFIVYRIQSVAGALWMLKQTGYNLVAWRCPIITQTEPELVAEYMTDIQITIRSSPSPIKQCSNPHSLYSCSGVSDRGFLLATL